MLATHRRDRRPRRQDRPHLEGLDDRLVLSAATPAAGAVAELVSQVQEARTDRHEARLARIHARHEARLAALAAAHFSASTPVTTPATGASAPGSAISPGASPVTAATSSASGTAGGADPSGPANPAGVVSGATPQTTTSTLPDNVAAVLQAVYAEYESDTSSFKPSLPSDNLLVISGDNVEVSLKIGSSTNFAQALSQLKTDGMQVSSSSATYNLIVGMLPIAQLPAAASIAASVNAVSPPILR